MDDLRAYVGASIPALPEGYGPDPEHETNFLRYARDENIPAQTVNALYEFAADHVVLRGGVLDAATEAEFRQRFAGELSEAQMNLLVQWWREEVVGARR